jgi:hypothetical protein
MPANVNWQAVAAASPVIVMYMAVKNLGDIAAALMAAGRPPEEPVTIVSNASLPHQLVQATTLGGARTFVAANEPPTPPSWSSALPPTGAACSTGTRARCGRRSDWLKPWSLPRPPPAAARRC